MLDRIRRHAELEARKAMKAIEYGRAARAEQPGLRGEIRAYNDIIRLVDTITEKQRRKDEAEDRELTRLLHTP